MECVGCFSISQQLAVQQDLGPGSFSFRYRRGWDMAARMVSRCGVCLM